MSAKNKWFIIIIVLYIYLGIKYSLVVPVYEAPDEPAHLDYIKFLERYKRLPVINENTPGYSRASPHPPLYYFLGALVYAPFQSFDKPYSIYPNDAFGLESTNKYFHEKNETAKHRPFYLLRLFSLLLGAGTILFTWKIANEFFEGNYFFPVFATALNAFLPQFIFISSSVSNDPLVNLIASGTLWFLISSVKENFKVKATIVKIGVLLGLAVLTKFTIFYLLPLAVLTFAFMNKDKYDLIKNMSIILLLIAFIAGWYFIRNYILYDYVLGIFMPVKRSLFSNYFIRPFATVMSISFVGVFGWMSIVIARPLYYLYFILYGIGLITAASRLFTKNIILQTRKKYDYILALMLFLGISSVVRFNMYEDAYQGRYLLNIISTFVILAAEGYLFIYIWFKGHFYKIYKFNFNPNDRFKTFILSVIIFVLFLMNIIIINIYIKPAYTGIYI